jgi:hypothetical protein
VSVTQQTLVSQSVRSVGWLGGGLHSLWCGLSLGVQTSSMSTNCYGGGGGNGLLSSPLLLLVAAAADSSTLGIPACYFTTHTMPLSL